MDPNTALANARTAAAYILLCFDQEVDFSVAQVEQLVESFTALDEWLSRDGFLPTDWLPEEEKTR